MNAIRVFWSRLFSRRILPVRSPWANFGCGETRHPAWDNFDFQARHPGVRRLDLTGRLPLPDQGYELVYLSHVLEHLPREKTPAILAEILRVLRPGGILRIVVPDLERIVREYLTQMEAAARGEPGAKERHAWITLELMDQFVRRQSGGFMGRWWRSSPVPARDYVLARSGEEALAWIRQADQNPGTAIPRGEIYRTPGINPRRERRFLRAGERHQWMYDRLTLADLVSAAGFREVRFCQAGESCHPRFFSFGLEKTPEGKIRKPDSLFLEARKGPA